MLTIVKTGWPILTSIPAHERRLTTATMITLLRFVCVPFIFYSIVQEKIIAAICFFALASITDAIDGAVARYYNQKTFLGEWLDAAADKVLIITSFTALWLVPKFHQIIPPYFFCFVLVRESLLMVGSSWCYYTRGYFSLAPVFLARMSMLLYVTIMLWALIKYSLGYQESIITNFLMVVTITCAIISLAQRYFQRATLKFRSKIHSKLSKFKRKRV